MVGMSEARRITRLYGIPNWWVIAASVGTVVLVRALFHAYAYQPWENAEQHDSNTSIL